MANQKTGKRLFCGMDYREVQRSNANRRRYLSQQAQKWLKENHYRNVGWENIIKLYQKINDLLDPSHAEDSTLEALFLKADRIGTKYQTQEEIEAFQQALRTEVEAIANTIDQQFPDETLEAVDYGHPSRYCAPRRPTRKHNH